MLNIIWDMETNDPDDFITLLLLLGHPHVRLKAVTITPGTPQQIGLVRRTVNDWFGVDIPIGAYNKEHNRSCVSAWHSKAYGKIMPSTDARWGPEVLLEHWDEQTTLITGGPLKNVAGCLQLAQERELHTFTPGRLVAQGGFAGEGVVPAHLQLDKFKGRKTCPTFNLNGDPKGAALVLASPLLQRRLFVSKNVCHRVFYDQQLHTRFARTQYLSLAHALIYKGMNAYLQKHPTGKMFHDPLAACCAIDESIGSWTEVELYCEKGEWGATPMPGSRTWIITDYDHEKFLQVLTTWGF